MLLWFYFVVLFLVVNPMGTYVIRKERIKKAVKYIDQGLRGSSIWNSVQNSSVSNRAS